MKKYQIAMGFVLVLLVSTVMASSDSTAGTSFWAQYDTDKDGFINRQEAASMEGLAQLFDKIDSSKDDKLDKGELEAIHGGAHSHDHADKIDEDHTHGS